MKPCLHCARSKAKKKNVCKDSKSPKATEPGERVYLDLSNVTVSREDGSDFEINQKNWKSIVDESTGRKWCDFTPTKSGMVEQTCEWMHRMKKRSMPIKTVRLDPAGENHKLVKKRAKTSIGRNYNQSISVHFSRYATAQQSIRVVVLKSCWKSSNDDGSSAYA